MGNKRRVLGIVGSPRKKGNTNAMVDAVLQGAAMGGAGVEKVRLRKKKIKPCRACDQCREKGKCRHDDDMEELLSLMKESDIWVFGTPVYWWGPTAQMKAFIDRWYQDVEGLKSSGEKQVILVIPYGDTDASTARNTIGIFQDSLNYLNKDIVAIIEGPGISGLDDAAENHDLIQQCLDAGKKVAS